MDNNNPSVPSQAPIPNVSPIQKPVFKENPVPEQSSKKLVLWLVIGLVIIIVLVGGIYMYLSRQQAVSNKIIPTPSPIVQGNLENDLNAIEVASPEADFTSLDQDIQQL